MTSVAMFGGSAVGAAVASHVRAAVSFDQFACSLLSSSDVSDVVGQASAEGFPGTATPDPGAQASICDFAPQDGGTAFNVTVKVERYKSTSAAHEAFASVTASAQPAQVSGFDEATVNAGSARLRHGSDVVWIDMFVNAGLPPTALTTLAAAVAKHYTSPSGTTQKPAVAGPGDVDPCATSPKALKAAFHVAVTSEPAVSDSGTLACRYTFAKHGSVIVTTTTPAALAKLQPPMTAQEWYLHQRAALLPSKTVDLTGFPGQAAISFDTTAIAHVTGVGGEGEYDIVLANAESHYLKLLGSIPLASFELDRFVKNAERKTHTKVDPKAIKAAQDAINRLVNSPTGTKEDGSDLDALIAMLVLSLGR